MEYKSLARLFFIILLATITYDTYGQSEYIYHFDTSKAVPSAGYYNKVKVIDKRAEQDNIGYLRRDGAFSSKKIKFKTTEALDTSFEKFITRSLPGQDKQGQELLLIIHEFRAEDAPILNECASFYIKMDAFAGTSGNYKFIMSVDSFYERTAGNATRIVRPFISEKIFNVMSLLLSLDPENIKNTSTSTLSGAMERIQVIKKKYPVYTEGAKDGVYKGYEQFLANSPDATPIIIEKVIITESLTHYYAFTRKENGKKGERIDANSVFAAHYNGNWYISDGKKFNKMSFEKDDFYAETRMKGAYNHSSEMTVLFGAVGALASLGMGGEGWGVYKARLDAEFGKLMPVKRIK